GGAGGGGGGPPAGGRCGGGGRARGGGGRARHAPHWPLCGTAPLLGCRREPIRRFPPASERAEPRDQVEHIRHSRRVDHVDRDLQRGELRERLLAISRRGGDDKIGLERDDGLEIRRKHPANARLLSRRCRKIAEV